MGKITKERVIAHCREVFSDPSWPYEKDDRIAKANFFNSYIDALYQDRLITENECNTWTNPF